MGLHDEMPWRECEETLGFGPEVVSVTSRPWKVEIFREKGLDRGRHVQQTFVFCRLDLPASLGQMRVPSCSHNEQSLVRMVHTHGI